MATTAGESVTGKIHWSVYRPMEADNTENTSTPKSVNYQGVALETIVYHTLKCLMLIYRCNWCPANLMALFHLHTPEVTKNRCHFISHFMRDFKATRDMYLTLEDQGTFTITRQILIIDSLNEQPPILPLHIITGFTTQTFLCIK